MAPRAPAASLPRLSPMTPRVPGAPPEELLVDVCVTRAAQEAYHPFAPVDTALFAGGVVDPAWLSALSIGASMRLFTSRKKAGAGGRPAARASPRPAAPGGAVHVSEAVSLLRPILLGEPLALRQRSAPAREPHRLGTLATTRFEYLDAGGAAVLRIERKGIMVQKRAEAPRTAHAPPPDARAGKVYVCTKTYTPDLVATFCSPGKGEPGANPIHNDPAVSRQAGYARPIWGGTQGMHVCFEHLYGRCCPAGHTVGTVECVFGFRRPVFWDEAVELWFGQRPGAAPGVGDYAVLRPSAGHAVALEMTVSSVAYAPLPAAGGGAKL